MNTHLVNYDLLKPGQSYTTLITRLTQLGAKRILLSTWMVKGEYTCEALRDDLKAYMDANDRLFVADITNNRVAWSGTLLTDVMAAKLVVTT